MKTGDLGNRGVVGRWGKGHPGGTRWGGWEASGAYHAISDPNCQQDGRMVNEGLWM